MKTISSASAFRYVRSALQSCVPVVAFSAAIVSAHAQVPPPGGFAPPGGIQSTGAPARPGFFSRPFSGGTNRPAFPGAPGAAPAAPGAPTALPPGTPPGTTVIPPRPGGLGAAAGATPGGGAGSTSTNVVPKGDFSRGIAAGMIRFQEADLSQVLEFYADLTGRTILRSPQVPQNVKISLQNKTDLTMQEGIDALNTMLGLNGVVMIEEGAKFVKAVPAASVPQEAAEFTSASYTNLPDAKKVVAQIVQLKTMTPEEVMGIIQPFASLGQSIVAVKGSPVLILRDYAENVKRMMEIIEKVDVALPSDIENVVIPIKYALASDVANVLSGLTAGGSTLTFGSGGGPLSSGGGMGTMGMGTMGTMGGGLGNTMGGGFGGSSAYGNRFGSGMSGSSYGSSGLGSRGMGMNSGSSGVNRGYTGRLDQAVRRATSSAGGGGGQGDIQLIGNAKIIADERSNALLVFADRRDLPMITNIISKLDVVLPQVLIEALIMEVNLGNDQKLGVSMSQNRQDNGKLTTAGSSLNGSFIDPKNLTSLGSFLGQAGTNGTSTGGASSGFNYFGTYGKDFDFAVTAAASDSRINVLSRPRIQTSTAQQAQIFVGEQRPFVTGSYFSDFGGVGSRSQYALQDIGISLSVQPIINQEGLVTMTVAQDISQVGGTTKIDNNDVPITIHRTANAYVSVHDRDTIILGGFISTTKSKSSSGVPYLKDIPGLGMLFRSSSDSIQRVELVVLIRPTVLPTPESAALTAAAERDRLPSIKRAQREEEEFNQQQLEKARREEQKYERRKYQGR